ncbi:MAG: transposase [Limisphaerales bacterium]
MNDDCKPHDDVDRVPSGGVSQPPRRLRRLTGIWRDREGNLSYLLTFCVEGRLRVLDNEDVFQRFAAFLLDSPQRYHWFPRRFVVMPDHVHLIAHQGHDAEGLGQWIKALKAVVGGLQRRPERPGEAPDAASGDATGKATHPVDVGLRELTRHPRAWRWQSGFHDHKFRTPESETRKWAYICMNPVRYGLVKCPEQWPYGGELVYGESGDPRLIRSTPPLLDKAILIEDEETPGEGTRPTGETPAPML